MDIETAWQEGVARSERNEREAAEARIAQAQAREAAQQKREAAILAAQREMQALAEAYGANDFETDLLRHGALLNGFLVQTAMDHAGPALTPDALDIMLKTQREFRQTAQAVARLRALDIKAAKKRAKNPDIQTDSSGRLYDENGRLIYDFTREDGDGGAAVD